MGESPTERSGHVVLIAAQEVEDGLDWSAVENEFGHPTTIPAVSRWPVARDRQRGSLTDMRSETGWVTRLAAALTAESVRYESPEADAGLLVRPLWLLELGPFESWTGEQTWDLCFEQGTRCLTDPEGPTSTTCAEIIVARRLVADGFEAGWLNTYRNAGPADSTPRMDAAVARDRTATSLPAVAAQVGQKGTPDVFGSNSRAFVFVEVKRHPDVLNEDQALMLAATWTGVER